MLYNIPLQHSLVFKYQVDKEKYVTFLIPVYERKKLNVFLPVERSIHFLTLGEAIIWPIGGGGGSKATSRTEPSFSPHQNTAYGNKGLFTNDVMR